MNNCVEELCEQTIAHVSNLHGGGDGGGGSGGGADESHAKAYLELLTESSNSAMSVNRHLVMLASKSSFIELNGHLKNATTASKILTDPIEALAQVLGDASSQLLTSHDIHLLPPASGKQLWAKLRATFTATRAFSSTLKTRDDSQIGCRSLSLNPLQKKFMQLVIGGVVSNLIVGSLSSAAGGALDTVEMTAQLTATASQLSHAIPGLQHMIQDMSGLGDVAENATKAIGVVQAAAQTMASRAGGVR